MTKLTHAIYLTVIAILGVALIWLVCDAPVDTVQDTEAAFTISSIAVLPFVAVESEDSAKQLAATITSKLVQTLSNNSNIRVASERDTRVFAETNNSIREIGDKLSVSTILEGAVRELQGRVRVTVQLIDVRSDEHLWARTYDLPTGDLDSIVADVDRAIMTLTGD